MHGFFYAWSHGERVLRLQKSELSLSNRAFYKNMDIELLSGTRSLRVLRAPTGGNVKSAFSPSAARFLAREMPCTQCGSLTIYLNWFNNGSPFVEDTNSNSRKQDCSQASPFAANGY